MMTDTFTPIQVNATSTQELLLALENARYLYGAARIRRDEAWRLYEEAIDDGDREAIHDLLNIAEVAGFYVTDAYQAMEAAYAAYWARVN